MGHKCFISFKKEDSTYRDALLALFDKEDIIGKSLEEIIDSENADYVMQVIRNDYLKDSTVTIFLIGEHSSENEGIDWCGRPHNYFIQRELQASLYDGEGNTRNGILGLVLPSMYANIYKGTYLCSTCGGKHNCVKIDDYTVVREFSVNYYIEPNNECAWKPSQRYCILAKWDDFVRNPAEYVEEAFVKRSEAIADKIKIRNLR